MLLEWLPSTDTSGNTHYRAESQDRVYIIEPVMRNNQVTYTTIASSMGVNDGPDFDALSTAQRACVRTEAALTCHVITPAEVILDWAKQNPRLSYFDPRRLSYSCPDFTENQITEQLDRWTSDGRLQKCWAVLAPSRVMGHSPSGRETWSSQDKVPRRLRDTGDDAFLVDNGEIIPVYRKMGTFDNES